MLASVGPGNAADADSSETAKPNIRFPHAGTKPTVTLRKPWQPPPESARDRLRYDGRPFADWLAQVDTELHAVPRREAILALTAFGQRGFGPEVTKKLIELLPEEDLFEYVIGALGRLGPAAADAIPALEEIAKQDRYRPGALQALALLRGEKVDISRRAENPASRAEQLRREAKLRELLVQKSDELNRDMQDIERLQKGLGIAQSDAARRRFNCCSNNWRRSTKRSSAIRRN